jgi:hypothetical protein
MSNIVVDFHLEVMYIIDMTNVNKCDECGKVNGHEIWCNFSNESLEPAARPTESEWTVETTFGTRPTFKLAPKASLEAASNYALRYVEGAITSTLKRIA